MIRWLAGSEVQLQVGDVVRLTSGGPEMSVCEVSGDMANVIWFPDSRSSESSREKIVIGALLVRREITDTTEM